MSKYSIEDNKLILELEDDVAHLEWGSNWRIPISGEFEELLKNCYVEWTSVNGIDGLKMISKINGNFIFPPATGFCEESWPVCAGVSDSYWTSLRGSNQAFAFHFFISDNGIYHVGKCLRTMGHTVRPVYSK